MSGKLLSADRVEGVSVIVLVDLFNECSTLRHCIGVIRAEILDVLIELVCRDRISNTVLSIQSTRFSQRSQCLEQEVARVEAGGRNDTIRDS